MLPVRRQRLCANLIWRKRWMGEIFFISALLSDGTTVNQETLEVVLEIQLFKQALRPMLAEMPSELVSSGHLFSRETS